MATMQEWRDATPEERSALMRERLERHAVSLVDKMDSVGAEMLSRGYTAETTEQMLVALASSGCFNPQPYGSRS